MGESYFIAEHNQDVSCLACPDNYSQMYACEIKESKEYSWVGGLIKEQICCVKHYVCLGKSIKKKKTTNLVLCFCIENVLGTLH
jgi:hypothetical protein